MAALGEGVGHVLSIVRDWIRVIVVKMYTRGGVKGRGGQIGGVGNNEADLHRLSGEGMNGM